MSRVLVKELLNGKFHPSKINNGASSHVNSVINKLLMDEKFTDNYLTNDFVQGIDDYLANRSLFVFDLNFDDEEGYQLAIGMWADKHFEDPNIYNKNPKLIELMLKTFVKGKEVTYATYDENDDIIVKKIRAYHNIAVYESLSNKIKDAIQNNDYEEIFENSFLAEIVERGYTYEGFKARAAEEISKGLKNKSLIGQVTLSDDFLSEGPIALVYPSTGGDADKINVRLNKEFPSMGITENTTIPYNKVPKFKELSGWDNKTSVFGKIGEESRDDREGETEETEEGSNQPIANTFTHEQIDTFADAIVGKDLSKNEFLYYTGEIYDSWGKAFDSDYWAIVIKDFGQNMRDMYSFAWDTFFGGTLSTSASITTIGIIQGQWALASLGATMDAAITEAFISLAGQSTRTVVQLGRFQRFARAARGIVQVIDPRIWAALGVATIAAFGYSMWEAEETSHKERMEKRLLRQYMFFLEDAIPALLEGRGIGDSFRSKARDNQFLSEILAIFAIDKEVERRLRIWSRLSYELRQNEDFLEPDNEDNVKDAIADATSKGFADIPLPELDGLTEEQIEERQRFYKQAALMMNLPIFASIY